MPRTPLTLELRAVSHTHDGARALRDFSLTFPPFAKRKSAILGVPFAAEIRFVAAINSPISAAE